MASGIFIVKNNKLVELVESKYDSETLLQELLSIYPNLLAGKQINNNDPRRWLLIKREFGIPDTEEGTSRWSVDHLFLDQDGIPTLIEVKRSTDTRLRREVVGQMLDYAANAMMYWPLTLIRQEFKTTYEKEGKDPEDVLTEFLNQDPEPEAFWQKVEDNLSSGKFRLLFVADIIPQELQRIIEFLNEKMDSVEVLGVEIKQYKGSDTQSFVPRVIGQTAEAQIKKSISLSKRRQWDERTFFEELEKNVTKKSFLLSQKLFRSLTEKGIVTWGTGSINGSYTYKVKSKNNKIVTVMHQWSNGEIEVLSGYFFDYMKNRNLAKLVEKYSEGFLKEIPVTEIKKRTIWEHIVVDVEKLTQDGLKKLLDFYADLTDELKGLVINE